MYICYVFLFILIYSQISYTFSILEDERSRLQWWGLQNISTPTTVRTEVCFGVLAENSVKNWKLRVCGRLRRYMGRCCCCCCCCRYLLLFIFLFVVRCSLFVVCCQLVIFELFQLMPVICHFRHCSSSSSSSCCSSSSSSSSSCSTNSRIVVVVVVVIVVAESTWTPFLSIKACCLCRAIRKRIMLVGICRTLYCWVRVRQMFVALLYLSAVMLLHCSYCVAGDQL